LFSFFIGCFYLEGIGVGVVGECVEKAKLCKEFDENERKCKYAGNGIGNGVVPGVIKVNNMLIQLLFFSHYSSVFFFFFFIGCFYGGVEMCYILTENCDSYDVDETRCESEYNGIVTGEGFNLY
jgi:hypothetical protein